MVSSSCGAESRSRRNASPARDGKRREVQRRCSHSTVPRAPAALLSHRQSGPVSLYFCADCLLVREGVVLNLVTRALASASGHGGYRGFRKPRPCRILSSPSPPARAEPSRVEPSRAETSRAEPISCRPLPLCPLTPGGSSSKVVTGQRVRVSNHDLQRRGAKGKRPGQRNSQRAFHQEEHTLHKRKTSTETQKGVFMQTS